ncbi:MAG: S8 family serine peptidase [Candidatus Wallbacteria bacterium]|nr:S8 family serine peptidase [Candidatus Wallbacteria bacterium]
MQRALASVVVCSFLLSSSLAAAAAIDPKVQSKLDKAGPGDSVKVFVLFKDAPNFDLDSLSAEGTDAHQKAEEALRSNAHAAQKDFDLAVAADKGVRDLKHFWLVNCVSLVGSPDAIEKIAARDDVKEILPNEPIQLEPTRESPLPKELLLPRKNKADVTYTYGLKKLKIPELRQVYGLDGQGVKVGVIDTGCDFDHPDLKGKNIAWKDFVNNKPTYYDDQGHGTHVCGTIAGGATSGLAIGVAPGARIVIAKAFSSSGSAEQDWLLGAMQWITDPDGNPATNDAPSIVSNSWGGGPGRTVFLDATKNWVRLGIFPNFAAGNSGPGVGTVGTPGGFLEAFAIGATTSEDSIADFSSRGPVTWDGKTYIKPDVSAPGHNITSAKPGGGYRDLSGTSMATPHVSGLIALMLQAAPGMSIAQMRELLENTSDDLGDHGKDNTFGAGRVNALAAAQIAVSGGKVVGKLTDSASGSGLKGTIRVKENGFVIQTGADGSFRFVLPAGNYTLKASSFGYTESSDVSIALQAQHETNADIALARAASGTVSGKVVSAATGEELQAKITVLDTPLDPVSTTGNGGRFSISLPGGTYKFLVRAFGYEPLTSGDVTVAASSSTDTTFKLAKLPPILIVGDAGEADYKNYFAQSLDAAGQKYSFLSSSALAGATDILAQYSVVVWYTGEEYRDTLTDADQAALTAFLKSGGRLFLTGQDIGYELKDKDFYKNVLKAKFVADASTSKDVSGTGFAFKIEGGDGANDQRYPDKIEALAGADTYLTYGAANGPAGLKIKSDASRVVYLPFGFEGIDSAANRKAVMADAMAYLLPTQAQRVARIPLVPSELRSAYADLMAREAAELTDAAASELAKSLKGADARIYGKVQKVLSARRLQGE